MRRALIILSTLVLTVLGWYVGRQQGRLASVPAHPGTTTPLLTATAKTVKSGAKPTVEVDEVFDRIAAELDGDHQEEERAARLFAELEDLKGDEFLSAIVKLSTGKNWRGKWAAHLLIGYWAERDLPAARQWLMGIREKVNINFCDELFETWANADLPGLFEWMETHAHEMPTNDHRDRAAFNVAKAAWQLDPERGIRLVKSLDKDQGKLWNLYNIWVQHDPKAASARLLQEPDAKVRERTIMGLISGWAPRDPSAARAWAEAIPDPVQALKTVTDIGSVVSWTNPRAGADYLMQIPQTNEAREALKGIIARWADRNTEEAFEWVAALENATTRDWIANAAIHELPEEKRASAAQEWHAKQESR